MAQPSDAWFEHQRRRFMRPDAHRYMRPDATRFMPPGAASCELPQRSGSDSAELSTAAAAVKAECAELLELKALVADLKFYLALRRFARKYRPDQARDDQGRWAEEGGTTDDENDTDGGGPTDISAARRLPPLVKEFGKWTVRQYVSQYCKASINRELPGEFGEVAIADVWNIAKGGDVRARTCLKLFMRNEYKK